MQLIDRRLAPARSPRCFQPQKPDPRRAAPARARIGRGIAIPRQTRPSPAIAGRPLGPRSCNRAATSIQWKARSATRVVDQQPWSTPWGTMLFPDQPAVTLTWDIRGNGDVGAAETTVTGELKPGFAAAVEMRSDDPAVLPPVAGGSASQQAGFLRHFAPGDGAAPPATALVGRAQGTVRCAAPPNEISVTNRSRFRRSRQSAPVHPSPALVAARCRRP